MKLFILQENFSKALNIVSRNISSKSSIPILSNVLIEAKGGNVIISGTNLETYVRVIVGAEIEQPGIVCVPAKTFADFINLLPSGRLELNIEDASLNVVSSTSHAKIQVSMAQDFPQVSLDDSVPLCELKATDLVNGISKVSFSTAKDNLRPILTGVLLEPGGRNLALVGADGNRLSKNVVTSETDLKMESTYVIPFASLDEVVKIVSDRGVADGDLIELFAIKNDNQILFKYKGVDFITRLIEGQFPDYQAAVPKEFKFRIKALKDEFSNAVKIANVFAQRDGATKIILNIDLESKIISFDASAQEIGSNSTSVGFDIIEGTGKFRTAFNIKYLSECLNHISTGKIEIAGFGPKADIDSTGGVFYEEGNPNFFNMIMPLRIS